MPIFFKTTQNNTTKAKNEHIEYKNYGK